MGIGVIASLHALICIVAAYFFRIKSEFEDTVTRAFALWVILLGPTFFIHDPMIFFVVTILCVILTAPKEYTNKVLFFVLVFPAAPEYIQHIVSLSSVNLIILTYLKVAILVVLAPSFITDLTTNKNRMKLNALDIVMIIFVVYMVLLSFRGANLTSVIRIAIDKALFFIVPYFVISRSLYDYKKIEKVVLAFFIMSLILCFIGILSSLKHWDFYKHFEPISAFKLHVYRFGLKRTGGIVNEGSLGICVGMALIMLQYLKRQYNIGFLRLWMLRSFLGFALLCSGIRGAILATFVMLLSYIYFSSKTSAIRYAIVTSGVICTIGYFVFEPSLSFDQVDDTGTFNYRYELLLASMKQVEDYPFIGHHDYINSPHFAHLLQGQGIIDFVNYYVQVVIEYGLIGLAMFVLLYAFSIKYIYQIFSKASRENNYYKKQLTSVLLSCIIGQMVFICTISNVSIIGFVGIILMAIARGFDNKRILAPSNRSY